MTAMRQVALQDVADINPSLDAALADDEAVPFLPMSAIDAEVVDAVDADTRPFREVRKGYTPFIADDVLVAKITPCFENGKIAQAKPTRRVGFGSTEFHVIRTHRSELDPRYLVYFLRQERIRKDGARKMTGSAGQRRVPEHFLANLKVPLPPLPEQRRIAGILDKADALRAKRRTALAQLDTLTQSIFLDMFGDTATNPKGWPVVELRSVVREGTIVTYGIVQAGDEFPGGVPYIRTGDIVDGQISVRGLRHTAPEIAARFRRSRVEAGDIVMSIRATVGTTAEVPRELDGANLTQGTARIAPGEQIVGRYLLNYLRAPGTQKWIERQIKGATFREITLARLRELPVWIPPMSLQQEFAARATHVARLKRSQARCMGTLDALFGTLQQAAFQGGLSS